MQPGSATTGEARPQDTSPQPPPHPGPGGYPPADPSTAGPPPPPPPQYPHPPGGYYWPYGAPPAPAPGDPYAAPAGQPPAAPYWSGTAYPPPYPSGGYPAPYPGTAPGYPSGAPGYPSGAPGQVQAPPLAGADGVFIGIPVEGAAAALKPAGARSDVSRGEDNSLTVVIPELGLKAAAANLVFITIWLSLIALGLVMMVLFSGPFFLIAFSIPFVVLGIWYLLDALRSALLKEVITVANGQFTLMKSVAGWKSTVKGECRSLQSLELKLRRRTDRPEMEPESWCSLVQGNRELMFGYLLKLLEQQWLLAELSVFMGVPIRHVTLIRTF